MFDDVLFFVDNYIINGNNSEQILIIILAFMMGLGLLYRLKTYNPFKLDYNSNSHQVKCEIIISMVISVIVCYCGGNHSETNVIYTIIYLVWIIYNTLKKIKHDQLAIAVIEGYLVTALGFESFPGIIASAVIIVIISVLFFFLEKEKSFSGLYLFDICISVVEIVCFSLLYAYIDKHSIFIILLIQLYCETAVYSCNSLLRWIWSYFSNRDLDDLYLWEHGVPE